MRIEDIDQERFWSKVIKTDSCWIWAAYRNRKGYGTFQTKVRVPRLVHRLSYMIATGADPGEKCVCHSCDNPACVRPDHLFLGTLADNNLDMLKKGRASGGSFPGELAPWSKLTAEDVLEIRTCYTFHGGGRIAAEKFGVTPSAISSILRGKVWRHLL
jgi:hypothetical protein